MLQGNSSPIPAAPPASVPERNLKAGLVPAPSPLAITGATASVAPPEHPEPVVPIIGFWQQRWVQNIVPLATSLALHGAIIILGLLTVTAYKVIIKAPHEEQIIIPDSTLAEQGPPGGVPNVGLSSDPFKQAMQDKSPDGGTPAGFAEKKGPDVSLASAGGAADADAIIGMGPGGGFKGSGKVGGAGGSGESTGALGMFGTPGGGAIGPRGPVFGHGGNAKTIIFISDGTGSMMEKLDVLKHEISKAVDGLKPIQSFNVAFFQDQGFNSLEKAMVPATPNNKRKVAAYLDDVSAKGTTNPLPVIEFALKQKPNLIYFLTDAADFPDNRAVVATFKKFNADQKTKVNTILFVSSEDEKAKNRESEELMKQISQENGGVFRWVIMNDLQ